MIRTSLSFLALTFAVACGSEVGSEPPTGQDDGTQSDDSAGDDSSSDDGATDDGAADDGPGPSNGPTPNGTTQPPDPSNPPSPNVPNPGPDEPGVTEPVTPPKLECSTPATGAPTLRLLTRLEFENTLNDVFPSVKGQWRNSLPANSLSALGFDNSINASVGNQLAGDLFETAQSVASAVTDPNALQNLLPCASAADRACAEQFVDTYGKRLFRRDVSQTERDRYLTFFDSALSQTDFATALKWVLVGLIQSPHAVYRSEIGTVAGSGRELTPHEIATALAYTFTGTTPSQELLAKADSGDLGDLVEAARTMLQSQAGRDTLHRFFEAYVGYPRTQAKTKPNATTDGITYTDVSADMVRETRAFIEDVVFNQSGDVEDLLTSPNTNPSQRLASYYRFAGTGSDYASVARPEGQGIGLLAQGSFLATHANSDASSPTQRGLFVYTRLLCQARPPVPDTVPQLPGSQPNVQTTRQRYEEAHSAEPACSGCHALFDPIGFSFENFDEAGRYRTMEGSLPIDASGSARTPSGTTITFNGLEELALGLAADSAVNECFAAYLATYAFGTSEACLGSSQVPALQAHEIGILEAFARLAGEPHFTRRNAQ